MKNTNEALVGKRLVHVGYGGGRTGVEIVRVWGERVEVLGLGNCAGQRFFVKLSEIER